MTIPQDTIETVKDLASIVEVVSEHVNLRRAGANYVGLCPFHQEKTPSFTVSEEKKIFHCFGCGEGGNVFTFLMKVKGLSFPDAVRELAARCSVPVPRSTPRDKKKEEKRKRLLGLLSDAARFFEESLESERGAGARAYLKDRDIAPETVKAFRLGFAPGGWEALCSHFKKKGHTLKDAVEAGLAVDKGGGRHRDRFVNRLIFPIMDPRGTVVGFGGRLLDEGETRAAKYINSPDGPLFNKSRLLYGLAQAAAEIRQQDEALVVEGYMDLIRLHQEGFLNCVAPLGTALTEGQARLMSRYAARAKVVFDGDEAGKSAAIRSLEVLLKEGVEPLVSLLPGGMDPDDFIREKGAGEFEKLVEHAESLVGFFVEETARAAGRGVRERTDALKRAVRVIDMVPDPVAKSIYLRDLAEGLKVPEDAIKKLSRGAPARGRRPKARWPATREEEIVAALFAAPPLAAELAGRGALDLFGDREMAEIAGLIAKRASGERGVDPASLMTEIESPTLHARVVELSLFAQNLREEDARKIFSDKVAALEKQAQKLRDEEELSDIHKRISRAEEAGDWELMRKLLEEYTKRLSDRGK